MGWVKDRFAEQLGYAAEVPKLWNRVRDSIGQAVVEFNERTNGTPNTLDNTDCMAKGKYCTRIHKAIDNTSIEVYLNENNRSLNTTAHGGTVRKVCEYRLTEDQKSAEFFIRLGESTSIVSVDYGCEMAISEFIFTPFPATATASHAPHGV